MINASPTPSSASAPTPKVNPFQATPVGGDSSPKPFVSPMAGGTGGGAPIIAKPKSKFNFKLWAAIGAVALMLAGSVAAYVMVFQTQDVRQQASVEEPGNPGCLGTQQDSEGVCGGVGGNCTNSCKCGYSQGACASKGIGEGCYSAAQCASGICEGGTTGTNGHSGVCRLNNQGPGACLSGWEPTRPASCPNPLHGIAQETQNNQQCYRCVERVGLPAGQTCQADQGCICQGGTQNAQTVDDGETCGGTQTGCWYINVPPTQSGAQPSCIFANICTVPTGESFVSENSCNQALQSGNIPNTGGACTQFPSPATYLPESRLIRGDHTVGTCSIDGVVYYACQAGYTFKPAGDPPKYACISNSYSASKVSCIMGPTFNGVEEFYDAAFRACNSSPGKRWDDSQCGLSQNPCIGIEQKPVGQRCNADTECTTFFCDFSQLLPGSGVGEGVCAVRASSGTGSTLQRCAYCTGTSNSAACANGTACQATPYGYLCAPTDGSAACTGPSTTSRPPTSYGSCSNGCCTITQAGINAGCFLRKNQCPGGEIPCNEYTPSQLQNGNQMCVDANFCGSQQMDLNCPGYAPDFVTAQKPAQCTNPSTPPNNPSPTPPVVQTMSCARMEVLDETGTTVLTQPPTVGMNVRFRCVGSGSTTPDYYFFTLRDNPLSALNLIYQGPSALTFPILITPFTHAQCNPCIGSVCSSGESVNANCNFQIGTAPTPTPPVGPQCLSIALNNTSRTNAGTSDPRLGETVNFTCGEVAGVDHYEFRVALPDGTTQQLAATGRNSANLVINQSGMYAAQCRICTSADAASCQEYEALPDTSNIGASN